MLNVNVSHSSEFTPYDETFENKLRVLENKIGRYWYKNDFGKILLDPDLVEIADEICNDYE